MCAYEVESMHVSKPCYINVYLSNNEFWFNARVWHILVTHVLILNTLSNSYFFLFGGGEEQYRRSDTPVQGGGLRRASARRF